MAEIKSESKTWDDMEADVLVKIFKELNMSELARVSQVCRLWRLACADPVLWSTLDLGLLKSNFIPTMASPYIWVHDKSDRKLTNLLRIAMALSRGNISCLIFHFNLYMRDDHLNYISERCLHLKRLVMPAWNRITTTGICQAIRRWPELESLTMPTVAHPHYVMDEISGNCKNFSSLKIMGTFDILFASAISSYVPKLKVLSLRCSILTREALLFVLNCMENLEVLNISHCMLVEGLNFAGRKHIIREFDGTLMEKASRLREFHHCMNSSCLTCRRMNRDEGLVRWYRYEGWFWRQDEVSSLSLGEDYGKLFDEGCLNQGFST